MLKKVVKWVGSTFWGFAISLKIISNSMVNNSHLLTPEDLERLGWVLDGDCWTEPNIQDVDKIFVCFVGNYYLVFIGKHKTFFALESSKEWFAVFMILKDSEKRHLLC